MKVTKNINAILMDHNTKMVASFKLRKGCHITYRKSGSIFRDLFLKDTNPNAELVAESTVIPSWASWIAGTNNSLHGILPWSTCISHNPFNWPGTKIANGAIIGKKEEDHFYMKLYFETKWDYFSMLCVPLRGGSKEGCNIYEGEFKVIIV